MNLKGNKEKTDRPFQNAQNKEIQSLNRKCKRLPSEKNKGMVVWDTARAIEDFENGGVELIFSKKGKVINRTYFTRSEMLVAPIEWILFIDGLLDQ